MAAAPAKYEVTNNAPGPRYLFAGGGMEVVPSGATVTVLMSETQVDAAGLMFIDGTEDTPVFTVKPVEAKAPLGETSNDDALGALTIAQLRDLAASEEIDLGTASAKADIVAAIVAARAAKDGSGAEQTGSGPTNGANTGKDGAGASGGPAGAAAK